MSGSKTTRRASSAAALPSSPSASLRLLSLSSPTSASPAARRTSTSPANPPSPSLASSVRRSSVASPANPLPSPSVASSVRRSSVASPGVLPPSPSSTSTSSRRASSSSPGPVRRASVAPSSSPPAPPSSPSASIARRASTMSTTSPGPSTRRKSTGSVGSAPGTPRSASPASSRSPSPRKSILKTTAGTATPPTAPSPTSSSSSPSKAQSKAKAASATAVVPTAAKVSESLDRAMADLERELPTQDLFWADILSDVKGKQQQQQQPPTSSSSSSPTRSQSPSLAARHDQSYTVAALGPPAIPVRSSSPSPVRPPPPTEIAFGRHLSPAPSRPPSPPRPVRVLARGDGQPPCENNCGRCASLFCEKCEIQICTVCDALIHGNNSALKRHPRVHLVDKLQICEQHREAMRLFCSECTTLVCQRCVACNTHKFPDGRGHPVYDVETAAEPRRAEIVEMAQQIRRVADSAPRTLEHLRRSEAAVQEHIDQVTRRLREAVDAYQVRLWAELRAYMSQDQEQIERHIESTATVRRRLETDADNAEHLASTDTPAQTFLLHWRDLKRDLQQDLSLKLGQPEPAVKMHVELTGQVQSGKVMTLEMEIQRVLDALNRCGRPTDVPRNAGHIVVQHPV